MKLSLTHSTRTYYINHNFYVDIVSNYESEYYEAWIWNDKYSIKEQIMSAPMEQQTITEFMDIIENNIQEDIKFYVADHLDYLDKEEFYAKNNILES